MAKKTFALEEPKKFNPRIYAYSDTRWPRMLKVGYTSRTVKERMKEHYPTLTPTISYTVHVDESALDKSGKYFKDYPVHEELLRMGFNRVEIENSDRDNGEWFECSVENVREAIIHIQQGIHSAATGRFLNFPMRKEQKDAVDKTAAYFDAHPKENGLPAPQFLWNCKMRFGKTFATYQLMKKLNWQKILVLTYKPAVRSAWRDDLNEHIDFDGYQFVSNGENKFGDKDLSYEQADKTKPIVWFASFQDFLGKDENGELKPRNQAAADIEWDCIVIDESHFGAGTTAAQLLTGETAEMEEFADALKSSEEYYDEDVSIEGIKAIAHLKTKTRLFLSGTPFKALRKGQFDDDAVYSWDYSKEQQAKADWDYANGQNPYLMLPEVRMYLYEIPEKFTADFFEENERNEFSLNEFFRANMESGDAKTAEFVHKAQVQKWLDMIRGGGEWEFEQQKFINDDESPVMPYGGISSKSLAHTVWFFQNVASCYAMKNLLDNQTTHWNAFEVICCAGNEVGVGEQALKPVEKALKSNKKPTITLSCGKLMTGVTVPEWSGIFMLNDKKSPEAYFQSAFRVQSPWYHKSSDGSLPDADAIRKNICYIFDFSPTRALEQVKQYAEGLIGQSGGSSDIETAIKNFIKFLPIICCDDSGMRRMDPNDILSKIYCGESSPSFVRKVKNVSITVGEILEELKNNKELYQALRAIDPTLPEDGSNIDEEKTNLKSGDGNVPPKNDGKKPSKNEKEVKSDIDKIRDRIRVLCSRIPLFMYLTDKRERDIADCLNNETDLFKTIVGIQPEMFNILRKSINDSDLRRIIYSFKLLEDSSFGYYGYNKHKELERGVQTSLNL